MSTDSGRLILQADRTSLHQADDGQFFLISPRGNTYPVDPTKPELFRVCAIWLGLTLEELCRRIDEQK
jgi:hypothetical protein